VEEADSSEFEVRRGLKSWTNLWTPYSKVVGKVVDLERRARRFSPVPAGHPPRAALAQIVLILILSQQDAIPDGKIPRNFVRDATPRQLC